MTLYGAVLRGYSQCDTEVLLDPFMSLTATIIANFHADH